MLANRQVRDETIKTSELSNSQKGTHFVKGPIFFQKVDFDKLILWCLISVNHQKWVRNGGKMDLDVDLKWTYSGPTVDLSELIED